jgi:hypothetical protein
MMLIRKKTGYAKLLATLKYWQLGWKRRKREISMTFILPIVAMRKIGSKVGDEQERGKQKHRGFAEA